jgi:predicted choloylglycine hydrolase
VSQDVADLSVVRDDVTVGIAVCAFGLNDNVEMISLAFMMPRSRSRGFGSTRLLYRPVIEAANRAVSAGMVR